MTHSHALRDGDLDYSLLRQTVPPIAGVGSEVLGVLTGWSWCGYCGYTGRCLGPRQQSCPERNGWHRWLEECANHELPTRLLRDLGSCPNRGQRTTPLGSAR